MKMTNNIKDLIESLDVLFLDKASEKSIKQSHNGFKVSYVCHDDMDHSITFDPDITIPFEYEKTLDLSCVTIFDTYLVDYLEVLQDMNWELVGEFISNLF